MNIQKILADHQAWLAGDGGARADLSGTNLHGADLREADLSGADLRGADLREADLSRSDLSGADLRGADLREADLSGSDLYRAKLSEADLRKADLSGADLRRSDLRRAKLSEAYLHGVILSGTKIPDFQIPQDKDLKVWKKLANSLIAELLIPKEAKRTASLVGNKCRAEYAMVVAIQDRDGREVDFGYSIYDGSIYTKGQIVRPDSYDDDPRIECTHGIHFFMDRAAAEKYNG